MTKISSSHSANVLAAGFAWHEKPFHTSDRDGLPSYLFRLQAKGRAHTLVNGSMVPVVAGDLVLYRPGDPYELHMDTDVSTATPSFDYFLFCEGPWLDMWWNQSPRLALNRVPMDDSIVPIWQQIIINRKVAAFGVDESEVSSHLLRALCLIIDRVTVHLQPSQRSPTAFVAHQMKQYIEQHATSVFTIDDVAHHVGLSVSRTVHLFKETFGQTLMSYALDVRLNMACERIRYGTMPLEQAAASAGFRSYSYFHRVFKARFGVSPRAYRVM